jgi:hypothetical protein
MLPFNKRTVAVAVLVIPWCWPMAADAHRQYDPGKRRFAQRDPLMYYESLNSYQCSLGNPMMRVDPEGTSSLSQCMSTLLPPGGGGVGGACASAMVSCAPKLSNLSGIGAYAACIASGCGAAIAGSVADVACCYATTQGQNDPDPCAHMSGAVCAENCHMCEDRKLCSSVLTGGTPPSAVPEVIKKRYIFCACKC